MRSRKTNLARVRDRSPEKGEMLSESVRERERKREKRTEREREREREREKGKMNDLTVLVFFSTALVSNFGTLANLRL